LNRQIGHLFAIAAVLFVVLVGATTWWGVFTAEGLDENPKNRRALIRDARIPRGLIYANDGRTVLARNRPRGSGKNRFFTRIYPSGPLFSHAVGYSFIQNGQRGLEKSDNDDLAGKEDEFQSILSGIESEKREGFDVVTNLDPDGQKAALQDLGGRKGAVVALEPSTGKVLVMASVPPYDANEIPDHFPEINRDPNKPLLNRPTQELYPPGSTFKVVTAAAALDSGKFTPQSTLDGGSPKTIGGAPLANFGGQSFGPVSLTDALTNSVNTVWAQVGVQLGPRRMIEYMQRFGFYQDPKLDYPADFMVPSGVFNARGQLVRRPGFDVGRVAIGQGGREGQIRSSALQMALVAAAVGNGGKLMRPRLTDRVVRKDGRVKERVEPDLQSQAISRKAAGELSAMMGRVVEEGTGTAAALGGIKVAGKTGTAEIGAQAERTQPWFIGFAPRDNPKVAVAVTLENQPGGSTGGETAGPIAKNVIQTLLKAN